MRSTLLASLTLLFACSMIEASTGLAGDLCRNVECKFFASRHIGEKACVTLCKDVRCRLFRSYHVGETPHDIGR